MSENRDTTGTDRRPPTLQVKIELVGGLPPIWRRVRVAASATLADLHDIIQAAMPWWDYHWHEFIVAGEHYGTLDDNQGLPVLDEADITIGNAFEIAGQHFTYFYDLHDNWEHVVTLEKALDVTPGGAKAAGPVCTAGRGACPPEDSGSMPGYRRKLVILADPNHPNHAEVREFMGADWDPARFDRVAANTRLRALPLEPGSES